MIMDDQNGGGPIQDRWSENLSGRHNGGVNRAQADHVPVQHAVLESTLMTRNASCCQIRDVRADTVYVSRRDDAFLSHFTHQRQLHQRCLIISCFRSSCDSKCWRSQSRHSCRLGLLNRAKPVRSLTRQYWVWLSYSMFVARATNSRPIRPRSMHSL